MKKLAAIFLLFIFSLAALSPSWSAAADSQSSRRAKAGIKLFRAMLAADLDISEKAGADGSLALLIVYNTDSNRPEELALDLNKGGKSGKPVLIRKRPVKVQISNNASLSQNLNSSFAGIFVAEPLKEETLRQLISYSINHKIILYSPFEGDVERGVLGGISVEAKVQPYVNLKTLEQSGIRIKPFFMRVSKSYE
jgi:hypothetical protein